VVLQQPYQMGYQGVLQAARVLRGEAISARQIHLLARYVNQADIVQLLPKQP
jgi:ABC-type sugar transport system substrate-binding protein